MTKRFTLCHEQNDINGWTMSIVDWETEQPFDYTTYEVHSSSITDTKDEMEDLCLLLNELNDENTQLKFQLKECGEHKLFSRRQIEQENKELKHYKEAYGDEIVNIKHTIKTMMENERTEIGKNTLKQLWEVIQ